MAGRRAMLAAAVAACHILWLGGRWGALALLPFVPGRGDGSGHIPARLRDTWGSSRCSGARASRSHLAMTQVLRPARGGGKGGFDLCW